MTLHGLWRVLGRAVAGWWADNVPHLGAALSYYTLFSLAPILIVAIAIAGLAFGAEAVRGEIVNQIDGLRIKEGITPPPPPPNSAALRSSTPSTSKPSSPSSPSASPRAAPRASSASAPPPFAKWPAETWSSLPATRMPRPRPFPP